MIRKTTKSCFFAVLASFATELAASDLNSESTKLHVVEDFEGKNATSEWMTVNDNVMGGRSKGGFSIKRGKLLFSGSTNTNGGGFSSIRMKPNQLALAGKEGILIRFKGDGRTYKFDVRMGRSSVAHRADFKTDSNAKGWQTVRIPFKDLTATWRGMRLPRDRYGLDLDKISSVGFMIYDKKDGPFQLRVDWVKAY